VIRAGRRADFAHRDQVTAAFGQCADQEHHAVDEAPRQVAADRADEEHPDVFVAGGCDVERSGKRQRHDQPEQDLGHPGDRIEQPLAH
jgi:hypothetical protein